MPTRKALVQLICILVFICWVGVGGGEKFSYKVGKEAGLLGRTEPDLACSKTGTTGPLGFKTLVKQRSLDLLSSALPLPWLPNYASFWCLLFLCLLRTGSLTLSLSCSFCLFRHLNPSWLWLLGLLSLLCLMTFLHSLLLHSLSCSALPCFGSHFHSRPFSNPWSRECGPTSGEDLTLPSARQPRRAPSKWWWAS